MVSLKLSINTGISLAGLISLKLSTNRMVSLADLISSKLSTHTGVSPSDRDTTVSIASEISDLIRISLYL